MLLQYYTGLRNFLWCTMAVKIEHRPECAVAILHRFARFFVVHRGGEKLHGPEYAIEILRRLSQFFWCTATVKNYIQIQICYCNIRRLPSIFFCMHGNREKLHMGWYIPS
jgi:hypothetical protein